MFFFIFTGKFVPILPYYLDILSGYNFGKKTSKVSMKPMDFSCVVKCSKSQLNENGFKGIYKIMYSLER